MRKIFIDCGAHTGSSVRFFCQFREDWKEYNIYSFEPDPQHWACWPTKFEDRLFTVIPQAVWIEDCVKDFHITKASFRPEGGSTLDATKDQHNKNKYQERQGYDFVTVQVNCFDIDAFIKANFTIDDYIVLKMDVEGAEYDIVKHMLVQDTFKYVDEFYIEWHNWRAGRCPKPYDVRFYKSPEDLEIERILKEKYDLECKFWDAIDV